VLLVPPKRPKPANYYLSAVRDCLFNIFVGNPPYLEAVFSIRNPMTHRAIVKTDPLIVAVSNRWMDRQCLPILRCGPRALGVPEHLSCVYSDFGFVWYHEWWMNKLIVPAFVLALHILISRNWITQVGPHIIQNLAQYEGILTVCIIMLCNWINNCPRIMIIPICKLSAHAL
jgi:hypothetical protein